MLLNNEQNEAVYVEDQTEQTLAQENLTGLQDKS